jgi:cytochrome c biogenesis protein CcdA
LPALPGDRCDQLRRRPGIDAGLHLSLFFVLGIAITYAILGLVAAGAGRSSARSDTTAIIVVAIFAAIGAAYWAPSISSCPT